MPTRHGHLRTSFIGQEWLLFHTYLGTTIRRPPYDSASTTRGTRWAWTSVCPKRAHFRPTRAYSGALRRMLRWRVRPCAVRPYAHFRDAGPRP